jgi:hypothetical protein
MTIDPFSPFLRTYSPEGILLDFARTSYDKRTGAFSIPGFDAAS